jgi:hypothetical protein
MSQTELNSDGLDLQNEGARLETLTLTGILDSPPESGFDAITRLVAEYFQADSAGTGFADGSRVWIKSYWGEHPERGLLYPKDFIPIAEENELILPIGDWVLSEACNQIQRWCTEDPGHGSLRVCVNLSARQFSREGLADHISALLLHFGISGRHLGLEMTESSLIPNKSTALEGWAACADWEYL